MLLKASYDPRRYTPASDYPLLLGLGAVALLGLAFVAGLALPPPTFAGPQPPLPAEPANATPG